LLCPDLTEEALQEKAQGQAEDKADALEKILQTQLLKVEVDDNKTVPHRVDLVLEGGLDAEIINGAETKMEINRR
jgi:hypothetical protein